MHSVFKPPDRTRTYRSRSRDPKSFLHLLHLFHQAGRLTGGLLYNGYLQYMLLIWSASL